MLPKDQVDRIIADLSSLSQSLGELNDLKEAISRAKADVESMNAARGQAQAQMREAQAGLSQAQIQNQKRFEQDMFNKQGQLKSLTERIAAFEERAKELTEEVRSKGLQLQSIESAFNDARRRLAG